MPDDHKGLGHGHRAPNGLVYRPAAQQRMSHVFGVDIFITYPSTVGVGDRRRRRGRSRSVVVSISEEGRARMCGNDTLFSYLIVTSNKRTIRTKLLELR